MIKSKVTILLFCWFVLLSGCVKLPSVLHDTAHLYPKKLRDGTPIVTKGVDLSYVKWWKKLKDPTLNRLMKLALYNNTELESSWQNILGARAKLQAAYAAWIPTLSFNPRAFALRTWNGNLTSLGPATRNTFRNLKDIKLQGYLVGFVPDYSINIMQNIYNDKMAKELLHLANAQFQAEKLSIISQVIGSYFLLAAEQEQLKLEKKYIHDVVQLRHLEKVRFKSGADNINSVIVLDQTLSQLQGNIPKILDGIEHNENAIRLLLNKNPGPIYNVHSINIAKLKHLIPSKLSSVVLKNRPDLMLALDQVRIAGAQVGVAYSVFFPTISLTNLIGSSSVELANLLKATPNFWMGQITGALNLLNVGSYRQIKAAKAEYYAAYYAYIHTLRSVFADVNNSLTSFKNNYKTYEHSQTALRAAQQQYYLARHKFEAGAEDYRLVLNAKINFDSEKLSLNQQKMQVLDAIVKAYQSLGGGYNAHR